MIDELRTLVALGDLKTMTKTATYLRVSQSTVTKRIQNLERITGQEILIPVGRNIELTMYGRQLANEAPRVLREMEMLLLPHPSQTHHMRRLVLGVGESILTSWVARSLIRIEEILPNTTIEVHAHRAQVVIDRVMSGEYHLGLGAKRDMDVEGLHFEEISREPFVLIPSGLRPFRYRRGKRVPVVTIEESAHSWKQIQGQIKELDLYPVQRLESFFAAAQLSINGFGHGLVPLGTAEALGVADRCERSFSGTKLYRTIGIFGRKRILNRFEVSELKKTLIKSSRALKQGKRF